jgi:hypothetical protein
MVEKTGVYCRTGVMPRWNVEVLGRRNKVILHGISSAIFWFITKCSSKEGIYFHE